MLKIESETKLAAGERVVITRGMLTPHGLHDKSYEAELLEVVIEESPFVMLRRMEKKDKPTITLRRGDWELSYPSVAYVKARLEALKLEAGKD